MIDIRLDELIYAIYWHQKQATGAYIGDYWSELNQQLFEQFDITKRNNTEDTVQRIFNITAEEMFILGFKTALHTQKLMND